MNVDHVSGLFFSKPVALLVVYEIVSRPVNNVVLNFTEFYRILKIS